MGQIGTHLVGLFDPCFAALSFLIAVPASYVALARAAYLRPARGEVPWLSNKLMRPDLDSDHTEASAVPWNRARVTNTSWRASLRCAIQGEVSHGAVGHAPSLLLLPLIIHYGFAAPSVAIASDLGSYPMRKFGR
jgi:hypothetical protein